MKKYLEMNENVMDKLKYLIDAALKKDGLDALGHANEAISSINKSLDEAEVVKNSEKEKA